MKYINADRLRAEIDKRYAEYRAKMKTDDFTYYEGMADALDLFEQFLDTLLEQPVEGLDEEIHKEAMKLHTAPCYDELAGFASHFAEWGRKQVLQEIYEGKVKPVDKITAAWLDDELKDKEDK